MDNPTDINVFSLNNPSFCSYLIVTCLLMLKFMGLIVLTICHRMKNKLYISEEDKGHFGGEVGTNPTIDRVKRATQNDIENIPVFVFVAFGFLFANPPEILAHLLYYGFLLVRVLHSFVYAIYVVRQPTRAAFFMIGMLINAFLAAYTAIYVFKVGYLKV